VFRNPYGGVFTLYAPPLVGCPWIHYNYRNPPTDPCHSTSQVGYITSYLCPPMHQHMNGHTFNNSSCSGVVANPYYYLP
jgi:hypothetical protein